MFHQYSELAASSEIPLGARLDQVGQRLEGVSPALPDLGEVMFEPCQQSLLGANLSELLACNAAIRD
jgi:hypothetical protein